MKKFVLLVCVLGLLCMPLVSLATDDINSMLTGAATNAGYKTDAQTADTGLATLIGSVVRIFLSLLGVIFICYTIYGGFMWMTAAGNDEKVTKGRDTIRDGIIGLVITLGALAIYLFIRTALITAS